MHMGSEMDTGFLGSTVIVQKGLSLGGMDAKLLVLLVLLSIFVIAECKFINISNRC